MPCTAILVAAGSSRRMGFDKLAAPIGGIPVLARTLAAFMDCAEISDIILVTPPERMALLDETTLTKPVIRIDGGVLFSWKPAIVPETVQGRSFEDLLDEPGKPFREAAYSRFMAGDAVITERFSFTSYNNGKARMLYDLEKDPDENVNVADKPEYKMTIKNMAALLKLR